MNATAFTLTLAAALAIGTGAFAAPQPLTLTQQQKQTIERQLSSVKAQPVPANFTAQLGATAPQALILRPVSQQLGSKVQSVKNDDYAKLKNNEILIVMPTNRKVVALLHENASTTGSSIGSMLHHL